MSNFWGAYQYDVLIALALLVCQGKRIKIKANYECL